jgi:hypothetical protein
MKFTKQFLLAALLACAAAPLHTALAATATAPSAAPAVAADSPVTPAHLKAAHDLLAAMQAEKMMRTTASASRYPDMATRDAVMAKLGTVPPETIYQRLSAPLAKLVSYEDALELSKFYASPYGLRLLHDTYNSKPSLGGSVTQASKAERAELARPALVKARKALDDAREPLRHEMFVLLQALNRK